MNEKQDLFEKTFDDLWKTEEYNFGTTDEDGWHNFDDYTEYPFAIEEMRILANEYDKIKQQLQLYKDKEDKLREYVLSVIKEHETGQYDVSTLGLAIKEHKMNIENILQILNEESGDTNE